MTDVALEARHVTKHFVVRNAALRPRSGRPMVHAVDDVSLALTPGRIVALVGESGSGKTTVGRLLAQLEKPSSGEILLRGSPAPGRSGRSLRPYRRQVQVVFQDPFASLNAVHTVGYHLTRPIRIHGLARTDADVRRRMVELLERVQLRPAETFLDKFPHELSGGQRQRIAIARALAAEPTVLLADEPVSMLDVSIRLSVLNLLADLARQDRLAMLYITHDIASARYFADEILVMYAGRLVESGPAEEITQHPAHPYTQLLLSAAPNPELGRRKVVGGEPPSLIAPPAGCRFHPRCPFAMDRCRTDLPDAFPVGDSHWSACWLHHPPNARNGETP
ncbi:MAG: ABC transporter ATP-binding protein [Acidimicrobiales bacterium]